MDELINRLTDNGQYANDICLYLVIENDDQTLHYLDYLGIRGKDLETLANKCVPSLDYLKETVRFLRSGFLGKDEITNNLKSSTPKCFITRFIRHNEDWDHAYEEFAGNFRQSKKSR